MTHLSAVRPLSEEAVNALLRVSRKAPLAERRLALLALLKLDGQLPPKRFPRYHADDLRELMMGQNIPQDHRRPLSNEQLVEFARNLLAQNLLTIPIFEDLAD